MPELPEVETTRRGLQPHVVGRNIQSIDIRQPRLRWPVPGQINNLVGATVISLQRRAKYLLMHTDKGHMIWHLGMSGSMRILPQQQASVAHEHIQITFDNHTSLRYRDPRRFGALLFCKNDPLQHELLARLGPEPLSEAFNAAYLHQRCQGRNSAIKTLIMDSHIVVGIGNIYACESLFLSAINPKTRAGRISKQRCQRLVQAIKEVLRQAISQGGTTLQDFSQADGKPGYFAQSLHVYGQQGSCSRCGSKIKRITQGQRSTFYCSTCQH